MVKRCGQETAITRSKKAVKENGGKWGKEGNGGKKKEMGEKNGGVSRVLGCNVVFYSGHNTRNQIKSDLGLIFMNKLDLKSRLNWVPTKFAYL